MAKRIPWLRIKSNFTYTFEEAAELLGVTVGTVRRWARVEGLPYLSAQRPYLILGWMLKDFLKEREGPRGRKLGPTEVLCLTCQALREPLGMMVDYIPITKKRGRIHALCPVCGGICNRLVSASGKKDLATIFDLQTSCQEDA